jgi:hypothetical protein
MVTLFNMKRPSVISKFLLVALTLLPMVVSFPVSSSYADHPECPPPQNAVCIGHDNPLVMAELLANSQAALPLEGLSYVYDPITGEPVRDANGDQRTAPNRCYPRHSAFAASETEIFYRVWLDCNNDVSIARAGARVQEWDPGAGWLTYTDDYAECTRCSHVYGPEERSNSYWAYGRSPGETNRIEYYYFVKWTTGSTSTSTAHSPTFNP